MTSRNKAGPKVRIELELYLTGPGGPVTITTRGRWIDVEAGSFRSLRALTRLLGIFKKTAVKANPGNGLRLFWRSRQIALATESGRIRPTPLQFLMRGRGTR